MKAAAIDNPNQRSQINPIVAGIPMIRPKIKSSVFRRFLSSFRFASRSIANTAARLGVSSDAEVEVGVTDMRGISLPNVKDEPHEGLARGVR